MKEVNKELINKAKDLIDSGLENHPIYCNKIDFITFIRFNRRFLNSTIQAIQYYCQSNKNRLTQETEFTAYIDNEDDFNIIGVDIGEDSSTIDISSQYANLEVIYTVTIDDNNMCLTNDMAIRLLNDPENEVWLYEDELSELY